MPKLARNMHSLSHTRLLTHDMGYLVPCGVVEVLPGDKFMHSTRVMMRVQPLLKPVMHPVDVRVHHWFVPFRLLWDDWDAFITRRDPELTVPTIEYQTGVDDYTLIDHMGVPDADQTLTAFPIQAYNMIWNHAYRDQDLLDEVALDDLALKRIAWGKDYFTTARAQAQAGASIDIPFSAGSAPILGLGVDGDSATTAADTIFQTGGVESGVVQVAQMNIGGRLMEMTGPSGGPNNYPNVRADLTQATGGIDVNEFRQAMQMQKFLEHRNRYGSRHEDYLRWLGINPSDARLQNPEYLGGGKNTISFSEVLSTADSGTSDVGSLAGHGIAALSTRKYRRFFEESGIVLSLLSVRPRTLYMQQLHRMWLRRNFDDYWQKEFEGLGPQEIFTKELYGLHPNMVDILGYNGRHDEYRHMLSYVSGSFRTDESDWHYGRDFSTAPALNADFIDCVPTDRVYADTATPELYTQVAHNLKALRGVAARARF